MDGAGKINELKSFSSAKTADHNREVRQAADHVYALLVDLPCLFGRRRRIAFTKAQQLADVSSNQTLWSDYLVSRFPVTIEARKLHALFRPEGISERGFYDDGASVAPSVAGQSISIMALSRLNESLREPQYDADEEEQRIFGTTTDQDMNEGIEEIHPVEEDPPFMPSNENNETSVNILESFNYAVSSSGGSPYSSFTSERPSSPPPDASGAKKAVPGLSRISEALNKFSFPQDNMTKRYAAIDRNDDAEDDASSQTSFNSDGVQGKEGCSLVVD